MQSTDPPSPSYPPAPTDESPDLVATSTVVSLCLMWLRRKHGEESVRHPALDGCSSVAAPFGGVSPLPSGEFIKSSSPGTQGIRSYLSLISSDVSISAFRQLGDASSLSDSLGDASSLSDRSFSLIESIPSDVSSSELVSWYRIDGVLGGDRKREIFQDLAPLLWHSFGTIAALLQAEVYHLGQFSHPNLVKLIGYCYEDDHRLLVYEYMACGSLEIFRSFEALTKIQNLINNSYRHDPVDSQVAGFCTSEEKSSKSHSGNTTCKPSSNHGLLLIGKLHTLGKESIQNREAV
ncbi:hypothetical protein J5N97_011393 [Dioscorea zingiberensis]|uniref:Serine-threonine/tyrosine-protein kinase catalytic domain-containing protein n=1 Tax=Dioscorea zingiberensis TaxID=325984 RepID=A0A9D5D2Y8_9LILI|nr:hypothetical protein J5N97_011393 [Dioscorea zingiberensis]